MISIIMINHIVINDHTKELLRLDIIMHLCFRDGRVSFASTKERTGDICVSARVECNTVIAMVMIALITVCFVIMIITKIIIITIIIIKIAIIIKIKITITTIAIITIIT